MRQFPLMIFAAGFGTRMGALTKTQPKPLIKVAGKALIDHALDLANSEPVSRTVVNVHYLAEQIVKHLLGRGVAISTESDLILETGGGLRAAMPLLGGSPVLTLNSDAIWSGGNPLCELAAAWDERAMDALLLLAPSDRATGHAGKGDFLLNESGHLERANGRPGLVYLGAQIIRTEPLREIPDRAFSLNMVWDRMIAEGRAFGLVHHGGWCDVGHAEGILEAEKLMSLANRG